MNFIFSWSTRYLTRSLRSLVRYRVDHSKIKFISTRGYVISSIFTVVVLKSSVRFVDYKIDLNSFEFFPHTEATANKTSQAEKKHRASGSKRLNFI